MVPGTWFGHLGRWWRKYSRRTALWRKNDCCFGVFLGGKHAGSFAEFVFNFFYFYFLKRDAFQVFNMLALNRRKAVFKKLISSSKTVQL